MRNITEAMMRLIKSQICELPVDGISRDVLSDEFYEKLYNLSKGHDMAHIVGSALSAGGLSPKSEIGSKFEKQTLMSIFRYERLNYEYGLICKVLEDSKIAYIPLKGSVIKKYYPKLWMRTSCDIDILVKNDELNEAVAAVCDRLGYKKEEPKDGIEKFHDVSLYSDTGVHLELHFNILEDMENVDALLSKVWEYSLPEKEGGYKYVQTNEYLMFHHIAHMYYHFVHGGCGVKPFVDLYLLLEKAEFSDETVIEMCGRCGIEKFYEAAKKLSRVWFDGEERTELTEKLEYYILTGGLYGTESNAIAIKQVKSGGKMGYALSRIWLPYSKLSELYPSLRKQKWLLPFYQIRRWFAVLMRGRLRHSVKELKTNSAVTNDNAKNIEDILSILEL